MDFLEFWVIQGKLDLKVCNIVVERLIIKGECILLYFLNLINLFLFFLLKVNLWIEQLKKIFLFNIFGFFE